MESEFIVNSLKAFVHQVPNRKLKCYHNLPRAFCQVPDGKVTRELDLMESEIIVISFKAFVCQVPDRKLKCYHNLLRAFCQVPGAKVTC